MVKTREGTGSDDTKLQIPVSGKTIVTDKQGLDREIETGMNSFCNIVFDKEGYSGSAQEATGIISIP